MDTAVTRRIDMGYAEECERWAGEGFSGSEAADIASSGIRPRPTEEDEDDAIDLMVDRMRDREAFGE